VSEGQLLSGLVTWQVRGIFGFAIRQIMSMLVNTIKTRGNVVTDMYEDIFNASKSLE